MIGDKERLEEKLDKARRALDEINGRYNEAAQFEDWEEACRDMAQTARRAFSDTVQT